MVGYRYLLTSGAAEPADVRHWTVALITLLVTMALSVWGKGIVRASCALLGMIVGYLAAIPAGLLRYHEFQQLAALPAVQLPRVNYFAWSFDAVLIVPFLIAALANTLKAVALLTAAEKFADADWVRPDLKRIGGGVLADGLTTALSGAFCVFGANVSASSVGLSEATGVASRVVACAIIKGGIETIASRMLDARRTLVVGLAILTGLAVEAFPVFFQAVPTSIEPLVDSPLVLGTFVGFALNAAFRIGARRRAVLTIDPHAIDFDAIRSFMEGRGGLWGARRDVITRATFAAQQLVEVIAENCRPRGPIALSGSFDEFDLAVEARYTGDPLELPERRPAPDEIRDSEDGVRLLAGFLLRHNADRASTTRRGENCIVHFQFHH